MVTFAQLCFSVSECQLMINDKEQAFEFVAKIIFDRAVQLIIGGNPAYESELVLSHIEMTMAEWGYRSPKVAVYCDSIKSENDKFREMGIC